MNAKYKAGIWVKHRKHKAERFVIILRSLLNADGSISYEVNSHDSTKRSWTINEEDVVEEIKMFL